MTIFVQIAPSDCPDLSFPFARENTVQARVARGNMQRDERRALIVAVARAVIAHANELSRLDQAIGDGDHGTNMQRGFEAILSEADGLAAMSARDALHAIGMLLVTHIGGASGPLYGTLALSMARQLPESSEFSDWIIAFERAIEDVKKRGKSESGQKTLLDVFVPVHAALASDGAMAVARLDFIAGNAAEATRPMLALRGRAAFLGQRSVGHIDPGARSASLIFGAIGRLLGERFDGK